MSDTKFTPGPWQIETAHQMNNNVKFWQVNNGQDAICCNQFCWVTRDEAVSIANAQLIASAPDLYEALHKLISINDNHGPFGGEIYKDRIDCAWDEARSALAKARGEVK